MINYFNGKFSGSPKIAVNGGDFRHSTDFIRDFRHLQQYIGKNLNNIFGDENYITEGLIVNQGTGQTLNITLGKAIVKFNVEIADQDTAWSNPPDVVDEDIFMLVEIPANINNLDITGYTPGGSTNYVKLAYKEDDGQTRIKQYKSGSYVYELKPSYEITVDTTAPTDYEIELTRFTESGGTFTFDDSYRNEILLKMNDISLKRFDSGWISRNTWNNQQIDIVHNLNIPLTELISVKVYISLDSTLPDDDNDCMLLSFNTEDTGVPNLGQWLYGKNNNEIRIQTGTDGIITIDTVGAVVPIINGTTRYFKVVIYVLN